MNLNVWLPLLVLASSLFAGLIIFMLDESRSRLRTALNLFAAAFKVVAVHYMAYRLLVHGEVHEVGFSMGLGFEFLLKVDFLSLMFLALSSNLWLVTTLYAVGYLEGSPNRSRFFGFFSLCVTASTGIAMAGNLITFFIFYEFLTLTTYPLVVHRETRQALEAGRNYLWYTIGGGSVLFVGIVWLHVLAGPFDFTDTGVLEALDPAHYSTLMVIFALLIAGLGVKAALVPLHGWLPVAMIAPAPVSALLHAVAVVKAGAFGIVRVVFDVYDREFAAGLGLLEPLALVAAVTIVFGSVRALMQTDLKKRLAYSTVSQVSYITLGVAILAPFSTVAAIVHLVHQGIMKITLFFCAGLLAETLQVKKVSEMGGVTRRMPLTMLAFTVAALGMIGLPPIAGFLSKWYLGIGALDSGAAWVIPVLLASSMLNAAYFLPIIKTAWFDGKNAQWKDRGRGRWLEADWRLMFPTLFTAALALGCGLFAYTRWSPLSWAQLIVERGAL